MKSTTKAMAFEVYYSTDSVTGEKWTYIKLRRNAVVLATIGHSGDHISQPVLWQQVQDALLRAARQEALF